MKKITLFLSTILAVSFVTSGIHAVPQKSTVNKTAVILRTLETLLGLGVGAFSITQMNPSMIKDIRFFGGVHLDSDGAYPYVNAHSDNRYLVALMGAYLLVYDGIIHLNKELKKR